ncbi:LacI family DNA-binding transcriptional regulator [Pseudomonas vanderleydeniana]|uniref:LacI family DNA-binding transcriptional regulator n=1 Tax=Pseudomonas vanderleydeniana TaxID=2745495 RepID=A0A9E6PR36_9PSED|nr:LacI family DNA-binding transcriptional regulator [Pseudomonas vanderleydeniana]QXI30917.1 LacI family DNA-binding transcriptional regulator [Pseudomonas vanderleydeniana]
MSGTVKSVGRVTVTDVAKAAGVSVATVSRSFNLPTHVRDDVREKVLAVAAKLGYSPNPAAKALRLQKTNLIGAIIPTLDHAIYATMVKSFQERLAEYGYVVYVLSCGFDSGAIFDKVKLLVERGVEALLIVGDVTDDNLKRYLQDYRMPVVCTYSYLSDREFPFIGFDNYQATRQLVEYLLGLGHRNMAMLTGPIKGNDRQQARYQAFKDTLEGYRERCSHSMYEAETGYTIEFGERTLRRIRLERPEVTAVICNSDVIAFGVLSACKKLQLNVPKEISVVGYDNLEFAEYLDPPLTTLAIPASEMGLRSAEALIGKLKHGAEIRPLLLGTQLMIRQSSDAI